MTRKAQRNKCRNTNMVLKIRVLILMKDCIYSSSAFQSATSDLMTCADLPTIKTLDAYVNMFKNKF